MGWWKKGAPDGGKKPYPPTIPPNTKKATPLAPKKWVKSKDPKKK